MRVSHQNGFRIPILKKISKSTRGVTSAKSNFPAMDKKELVGIMQLPEGIKKPFA